MKNWWKLSLNYHQITNYLSTDHEAVINMIYHKDIKLEGDLALSVELSLEVDNFFTSLLHVIGPLVMGVSPVWPRLPVKGVSPVWSTIVSKLKLKNPPEGVVMETPADVISALTLSFFTSGRLEGRDVDAREKDVAATCFLRSCGTGEVLDTGTSTSGSSLTLTLDVSSTRKLGGLTLTLLWRPLTLQRGLCACRRNSKLSFSFWSIWISVSIDCCSFSSLSVSWKIQLNALLISMYNVDSLTSQSFSMESIYTHVSVTIYWH